MAMILEFQLRQEKPVTKSSEQHAPGQVIIFSGVRYERIPDASSRITKSSKKTCKTA
jgi:hypothetical protein